MDNCLGACLARSSRDCFCAPCIIRNKFIKATGLAHTGKGLIPGLHCTVRRARAERERKVKITTCTK